MSHNVDAAHGHVQEFGSPGLGIGIVRADGVVAGQAILCRADPEHGRIGVCVRDGVRTSEP